MGRRSCDLFVGGEGGALGPSALPAPHIDPALQRRRRLDEHSTRRMFERWRIGWRVAVGAERDGAQVRLVARVRGEQALGECPVVGE